MSKSARSVFVFSLYLLALGITLLVAPNFLLGLFSMPATSEVWIRVVGMLIFLLGNYYMQAARKEMKDFFHWTIYLRVSVIFFLTVFAVLDYTRPIIILFGAVDLLGAVWTWLALRSENA